MTKEAQSTKRIAALDITRGIAVLGMIYMNFRIVLSGDFYDESYSFLTSQEGRFGVLFIFLAGIGVSLMTRRAAMVRCGSPLLRAIRSSKFMCSPLACSQRSFENLY